MEGIINGRSPLNSRRSRVSLARSSEYQGSSVSAPRHGLFKLLEEPNERQRKSYSGENRLICPSPLKIVPASPMHPNVTGFVQVRIVNENGVDDDDTILEGTKMVTLNPEHRADFNLKLVKNSRQKFRLKFTIQCQWNGQSYMENILSLPFGIITTKKTKIRRPELSNIHLKYGLCDRENEVWIKGKNFSARNTMEVLFGGIPANILETEENLILCMAPITIVEPGKEKQVEVRVANIDPKDGRLDADTMLIYTYCSPFQPTPQIKEEPMQFQYNWNTEANSFFNHFTA